MALTLIIHGGSGTIREEDRDAYRSGLVAAREAGFAVLAEGGSAVEAVLAAIKVMENNPDAFNAGTGGSPNRDGVVECDAAVMAGADRSCGAVAGLTRAKNPILVADYVRCETPHVMFVGAGADALVAQAVDSGPTENKELLTARTKRAFEGWLERKGGPVGSATVGAVALDARGHLAAATSTGGVLGKWPGRVGDSPLIGAGTYADASVAVSCTGQGEAFVRVVAAKALAARLERGEKLHNAVQAVLDEVRTFSGTGGLISLRANGEVCVAHNAPHMAYAWKTLSEEEALVGLEPHLYSPHGERSDGG